MPNYKMSLGITPRHIHSACHVVSVHTHAHTPMHTQNLLNCIYFYIVCQAPAYTAFQSKPSSSWCCSVCSSQRISVPSYFYCATHLKTVCCPLAVRSFPHPMDTAAEGFML